MSSVRDASKVYIEILSIRQDKELLLAGKLLLMREGREESLEQLRVFFILENVTGYPIF